MAISCQSDEKRQKEDPDQDGSSNERCIDEWLSRGEKKLAALTSGRYLMQDTAQNKAKMFLISVSFSKMGLVTNYFDFDVDN